MPLPPINTGNQTLGLLAHNIKTTDYNAPSNALLGGFNNALAFLQNQNNKIKADKQQEFQNNFLLKEQEDRKNYQDKTISLQEQSLKDRKDYQDKSISLQEESLKEAKSNNQRNYQLGIYGLDIKNKTLNLQEQIAKPKIEQENYRNKLLGVYNGYKIPTTRTNTPQDNAKLIESHLSTTPPKDPLLKIREKLDNGEPLTLKEQATADFVNYDTSSKDIALKNANQSKTIDTLSNASTLLDNSKEILKGKLKNSGWGNGFLRGLHKWSFGLSPLGRENSDFRTRDNANALQIGMFLTGSNQLSNSKIDMYKIVMELLQEIMKRQSLHLFLHMKIF
ncbi:hypothetical protein B6S12_03960 [Helicobacter valdiviensis]|uniref:Uncharacterized protein n=1 Tax=Helicobacter valdiviensis TaxID=1458358 RepID=A0A2W6MVW6_9HELI|nr:hypothetical protein [Helicobacter valdiviensis]PZT48492.1 hypothetical protein B6S12_03960 [Helicobacter valdiviensis]